MNLTQETAEKGIQIADDQGNGFLIIQVMNDQAEPYMMIRALDGTRIRLVNCEDYGKYQILNS